GVSGLLHPSAGHPGVHGSDLRPIVERGRAGRLGARKRAATRGERAPGSAPEAVCGIVIRLSRAAERIGFTPRRPPPLPGGRRRSDMLLDIVPGGEPRSLRLMGELDISNAEETLARLEAVAGAGEGDLTLDLSELTFIDSSGIRVLLKVIDGLDGRGRLILRSPRRSVYDVLSLMGLGNRQSVLVLEGPAPPA